MAQIPFGYASAVIVALATACVAAEAPAGAPRVAIRVYDTTQHDPSSRSAAFSLSADTLAHAGIATDWRDCSPSVARCDDPRRKGELVLRIVPIHVVGYDQPSGSIATRRTASDRGFSLAFAVVEPRARVGALATVFFDRVQLVARRAGVEVSTLLGHTIAHEIGHLLLGTGGHSPSGLMREVWTDEEVWMGRPDDWLFSPSDRKSMLSGIKRLR